MGLLLIRPGAQRNACRLPSLVAIAVLAACGGSADPKQAAESITRAVYANDMTGVTERLDDGAKHEVTRQEVGALSDRMHALGDLKGVSLRNSQPDSGRYEFDATFSRGMLLVQLRMDPNGKVGAYRVVLPQTRATS